jgi:DNA-binding GntR family transcriptional regulator
MSTSNTVVDYTIAALREAIREGTLAQGQRLVVADVARMLGVSNGPVREAIRRLTGEGLVEITPHRGASVRQYTSRDIRDVYQIREVLEGLAARLAAERIADDDHRARLQALIAEIPAACLDGEKYLTHNHDFHELIYEMSGNTRLREQAQELILPIYRLRYHQFIDLSYARTSAAEHQQIAEAILEGDGVWAERAMRNHVRNSGLAMLGALDASRPQVGATRRPRETHKDAAPARAQSAASAAALKQP